MCAAGDAARAASVYKGYNNLLAEDVADNVVYVATRQVGLRQAQVLSTYRSCTTSAAARFNMLQPPMQN